MVPAEPDPQLRRATPTSFAVHHQLQTRQLGAVQCVTPSRSRPGASDRVRSDGRALVRRGLNRPLFGSELLRLLQERISEPFDSTDARVPLAGVPLHLLQSFRTRYSWREDASPEP